MKDLIWNSNRKCILWRGLDIDWNMILNKSNNIYSNLFFWYWFKEWKQQRKSRGNENEFKKCVLDERLRNILSNQIDFIPFEVFEKSFSQKRAQMAAILFLINDFPSFHLHPQRNFNIKNKMIRRSKCNFHIYPLRES